MQEKEQEYAKRTFDEVANNYDEIPFFKMSAEYMADVVEQHTKKRPLNVLDVACGTGNVVLACASRIDDGTFDAIDISKGMLAKAKENALKRNLTNIDFHLKDVINLNLNKKYHLITCSYALFFLPNATGVLKSLITLLKPRGKVIFTTFTAQAFSPSNEILLPLLRKYGSPTAKEYDIDKWQNLRHKRDIERLCTLAYADDMKIETKEIRYGMTIDAWWELMNNTSYKGMLMELNTDDYELVKDEYFAEMFKHADMDGEVELNADTYIVSVS